MFWVGLSMFLVGFIVGFVLAVKCCYDSYTRRGE